MQTTHSSILALDVGEARIGIAMANRIAKIASPLVTLPNDDNFTAQLRKIAETNGVDTLVVGLPRSLDGTVTAQTAYAQGFADKLQAELGLPVHLQDEALTSAKAEAELTGRRKPFTREDIDMLSAVYILDDFLKEGTA
ncbi:MAG TPA: Holliday junction resolvase RuvX [Candidatus Saccharimonadales bacterium]|nr:Holliday junction resolvase RuvX [Candidatus Saccharimonadales bacterium]